MAATEEPSAVLAAFVSELGIEDIPEPGVRQAERCFVDTVGVTLAGATEGAGAAAARVAAGEGSTTVLGRGETGPLAAALLANGTAGHGLDFDDVCWGMDGHPSVTLVPAALGAGERVDASGADLVSAFVAGFETECYLAGPVSPGHYERGWHATATFGTFGATAAAASVLGLDADATRRALNVAASTPAGLKRNFGSMTKPLHVGHAVRSGVTAALLADEGFTADEAAVGGDRGFWDLYAGDGGVDRAERYPLGERWALLDDGVHVKKYPCCHFTHTSIASVVDVVAEHDVAPEDIERVDVVASRGAADALAHGDPSNGLEAKFSMPYAVACAAVHRTVDLAAFDPDALDDPAVQAVRERVDFEVGSDLPYDSLGSRVRVETVDGDAHERDLSAPPGSPDTPLSDEELRAKYEMCAGRALDEEDVAATWRALDALRERESTRDLLARL